MESVNPLAWLSETSGLVYMVYIYIFVAPASSVRRRPGEAGSAAGSAGVPAGAAGRAGNGAAWAAIGEPTGSRKNGRLPFQVLCLDMNTVPSFDGLRVIKDFKVRLWQSATTALPTAQTVTRSLHKGNRSVPSIFLFAHQVSSSKMSFLFSFFFPTALFFFSVFKTAITLLSQLHHRRKYPCVIQASGF